MTSNSTVVLGEASESDGDDISLSEENQSYDIDLRTSPDGDINQVRSSHIQSDQMKEHPFSQKKNSDRAFGPLGSTLFATIGSSSSTLAKLVNYSSQSLLSQPKASQPPMDLLTSQENKLPPLHRTLYSKNQQLHACMSHLYRHPYEKAAKDMHGISQRMVNVQKTIQDVDMAILKIRMELENFEVKINTIV